MGQYTGKPYRPSNGSEGMDFVCHFCENCIRGKYEHTQKIEDKPCEILSASFFYDLKDKEYPTEWVYDENDSPTCTAWVKWDWGMDDEGNWNDPPEPEPIDPNQLCMPFELVNVEENVAQQPIKETA